MSASHNAPSPPSHRKEEFSGSPSPPFSLLRNHGADSDSGMGRFPGYLFRSKLRPDLRKYQKSSLPQMGELPCPRISCRYPHKAFSPWRCTVFWLCESDSQVAVPDELAECNLLRLGRCLVIITAPLLYTGRSSGGSTMKLIRMEEAEVLKMSPDTQLRARLPAPEGMESACYNTGTRCYSHPL